MHSVNDFYTKAESEGTSLPVPGVEQEVHISAILQSRYMLDTFV